MDVVMYVLCLFFAAQWFRWKLTAKTMIAYYHEKGVPKIDGMTFRRLARWTCMNWFNAIFKINYRNINGKEY